MNHRKQFMKKSIFITNIIFIIFILIGCILFITSRSLWIKGIACLGFVIMGCVNLIYSIKEKSANNKYCSFILAGLTTAALADIVINIHFISGVILFIVGHMCFYTAQCFVRKIYASDFIYSIILAFSSLAFILFFPGINISNSNVKIVCIAYAMIISLMAGKSIANAWIEKTLFSIVISIGCLLFFLSDMLLAIHLFLGVGRIAVILCLLVYYPAQCLLAFSILLSSKIEKISSVD